MRQLWASDAVKRRIFDLICDDFRQIRFACSRWAIEQHAFRSIHPDVFESLWLLEGDFHFVFHFFNDLDHPTKISILLVRDVFWCEIRRVSLVYLSQGI